MFYEIRFQTGESLQVANEMRKGVIPKLETEDFDEFMYFIDFLKKQGFLPDTGKPFDKKARDTEKESGFEFRAAFIDAENGSSAYIDVYFNVQPEKTYDSVGEI